MIVYMGSTNTVCYLSVVAVSLMEEGCSAEEVVREIIDLCDKNGVYVHKYDVEIMLDQQVFYGVC